MLAIARQILEYKEREESTRYLLELLLQLFIRRNEFLKAHKVKILIVIFEDRRRVFFFFKKKINFYFLIGGVNCRN